jgi:endoglucanase
MVLFVGAGVTFIFHALASGANVAADVSRGAMGGPAVMVADAATGSGRAVRFGSTGCTISSQIVVPPVGSSLPSLPLTTNGRFIVSKSNTSSRVKLVSANWYGFEEANYAPAGLACQPLSSIVAEIKARGFNSVRLPWAVDSWNSNPVVPNAALTANPDLMGLHLRDLMDRVVNELARQGIMVVLDDHVSSPEWCCSGTDGNALWWEDYGSAAPPNWSAMSPAQQTQLFQQGAANWEQAWQSIITRYSSRGTDPQPAVVGADLRNEPRDDTTLGLKSIKAPRELRSLLRG